MLGSMLQHGPASDRIYLMKYNDKRREELYRSMMELALEKNYGKIFIKVPQTQEDFFRVRGFKREAVVPRYYGEIDCLFLAKYLKKEREKVSDSQMQQCRSVLEATNSGSVPEDSSVEFPYSIRQLELQDIPSMSQIYQRVFESYPFPIHDEDFLKESMKAHVFYFGCFKDQRMIGLSSAECDPQTLSAEMTDFAVLPDFRGKRIASHLLEEMESFIGKSGYRTAYTIARAMSFGMNKTFANASYTLGGTLINNTQISGQIESMNVWHRKL